MLAGVPPNRCPSESLRRDRYREVSRQGWAEFESLDRNIPIFRQTRYIGPTLAENTYAHPWILSARRVQRLPLLAALLTLIAIQTGHSAEIDAATCLGPPSHLEFAPVNAPPLVRVSHEAPPSAAGCFNKIDTEAIWITVASLVETPDDRTKLIRRFGAISELMGVKYWSVTDRKWRSLVSSAVALSSAQSAASRPDFPDTELERAEPMRYRVTDTRSGRPVTYTLRVSSLEPRQFTIETSNVDAVKEWGITFYDPGGLRTVYYLVERAPGRWAYASMTRIVPASVLARGHDKSYVNRAVALYRHYMHIPTDQAPPAAP